MRYGELHFVEGTETLEAARQKVETLAKLWPGQYFIYNEQTGERVSITAGETRNLDPRVSMHGII